MTLKKDLHCSAAELVDGTTLHLSAEFFHSSRSNTVDEVTYVTRLKETMMKLRATPTQHHLKQRPFISSDLSRCTHVFVRQNAVRQTLKQPYHSPHKVIERGAKTFTIDVHGKQEVISLDSLRPAHIEDLVTIDVTATDKTLLPPPPAVPTLPPTMRTTQSGRHVHWPDHYIPWMYTFTGGGIMWRRSSTLH